MNLFYDQDDVHHLDEIDTNDNDEMARFQTKRGEVQYSSIDYS